MDLQGDASFRELDVALLSIAIDPPDAWAKEAADLRIATPLLSDAGTEVAQQFGVMRWAMPSGEPGRTFVLVDEDGVVRWIRDYGAPENGGLMYVPPTDLVPEIAKRLPA